MIPDRQCRILVGETLIAMEAPDARLGLRLRRHFRASPPEGAPAITIRLSTAPRGSMGIPDSLFADKHVEGPMFVIGGGVIRGSFDRAGGTAEVRVDERLFEGRLIRVFEQLLYQGFASDPRVRDAEMFLLHSSGIVSAGAGYLFTGPSGAGKSTITRLSARGSALNDEICLVDLRGPAPRVVGTPFNGLFRKKREGCAPLAAVFVLSQARVHRISPLGRGEAVAALLPQIVPPIGLDEPLSRQTVERMLALATALQERVPVRRLEFRRDSGFWREIEAGGRGGESGASRGGGA